MDRTPDQQRDLKLKELELDLKNKRGMTKCIKRKRHLTINTLFPIPFILPEEPKQKKVKKIPQIYLPPPPKTPPKEEEKKMNIIKEMKHVMKKIKFKESKNEIEQVKNRLKYLKTDLKFKKQTSLINKIKTGEVDLLLIREFKDLRELRSRIKFESEIEIIDGLLNLEISIGLEGGVEKTSCVDGIDVQNSNLYFIKKKFDDNDDQEYDGIDEKELKVLLDKKMITTDGVPTFFKNKVLSENNIDTLFGFLDFKIREYCLDAVKDGTFDKDNTEYDENGIQWFNGQLNLQIYILRKKNLKKI